MRRTIVFGLVILGACLAVSAATPPAQVSYQGVLRDAAGNPLTGSYEMVFRFFDQPTGGNHVLSVEYLTGGQGGVTVTGGLFTVQLGPAGVVDGSGPGTYGAMDAMFRDYAALHMEIEVAGQVLSPRVPMASSGWALNTRYLNGQPSAAFVDLSGTPQTKVGPFTANAGSISPRTGITGYGDSNGGAFFDNNDTGYAYVGSGNYGINAFGSSAGGRFSSTSGTGWAQAGVGDVGIFGYGSYQGGSFQNTASLSSALLCSDTTGIVAYGPGVGGNFSETGGSGRALLATEDSGVRGFGTAAGGFFQNTDGTGTATLGRLGEGIFAQGLTRGGYFEDTSGTSHVILATGGNGIQTTGNASSLPNTTTDGGYFELRDPAGSATLATAHIATAWQNPSGPLFSTGAIFNNSVSGASASIAEANGWGISAEGGSSYAFGGVFRAGDPVPWVIVGGGGVAGSGKDRGGFFIDEDSSSLVDVAKSTYKITGTGSVAFVQNHPTDKDRVIVYNAPEGDEVATYTRGSARLVGGEARIPLGETFAWVTNPDLGLTAYVTPVGEWADLYVASKATTELVVRSRDPRAPDVTFDYIVYGLRIGFEETSIVQEKRQEAYIPSMADHRKLYADHPELRRFSALERVRAMRSRTGLEAAPNLTASAALRDAIHEFDPAIDRPRETLRGAEPRQSDRRGAETRADLASSGGPEETPALRGQPSEPPGTSVQAFPGEPGSLPSGIILMTAGEAVLPGDVLVFDPNGRGEIRRGEAPAEAGFAGIAVERPGASTGDGGSSIVAVAIAGLVACKVDAGYGAIRPGDLLTVSPTAGHAMRAVEPAVGTILGTAAEPLDAGTGTIKVLVMPR